MNLASLSRSSEMSCMRSLLGMNVGFIARGILLPSLSLTYLTCFALPQAFFLLPEYTAGPVIGLTLIGLNLYRYYPRLGNEIPMQEPLLRRPKFVKNLRPYSSSPLVQFVAMSLLFDSTNPSRFFLATVLAIETILNIDFLTVFGGFFVGTLLWVVPPTPELKGVILAVSSGVISHALVAHYLLAWNDTVLDQNTFALSAASVILLFTALCTLELSF